MYMSVGVILDFENELQISSKVTNYSSGVVLVLASENSSTLITEIASVCDMHSNMCAHIKGDYMCVVGAANGFLWCRLEGDQVTWH